MGDTRTCRVYMGQLREEYSDRRNYAKGEFSVLDLQQQVTGVNLSRIEEHLLDGCGYAVTRGPSLYLLDGGCCYLGRTEMFKNSGHQPFQ